MYSERSRRTHEQRDSISAGDCVRILLSLSSEGTLKTDSTNCPLLSMDLCTRLAPSVNVDVPYPLAALQGLRYRSDTLGTDMSDVKVCG